MPNYSQIRINKTKELKDILKFLQSQLKLLSEADILKLALSEFYSKRQKQNYSEWINNLPTLDMTDEEEIRIGKAIQEYKGGKGKIVDVFDDDQARKNFGV